MWRRLPFLTRKLTFIIRIGFFSWQGLSFLELCWVLPCFNYFERVKQRANRTNYRYYFFDYLYFKGEQGHKMRSRCSGLLMLSLYWWFIIEIPCLPLLDRNLPYTWYLLCCMGMFLFPVLFCLIRYRKDRTSALVNHYRHSSKNKITITLLLLLPMVLCGFELWLLAKLGWVICKWC